MVPLDPTSPAHLGLADHFSEEDIQELLGVMSESVVSTGAPSPGGSTITGRADFHPPKRKDEGDPSDDQYGAQQEKEQQDEEITNIYGERNQKRLKLEWDEQKQEQLQQRQEQQDPGEAAAGSTSTSTPLMSDAEVAKAQARSERKRSREKQRRSDVNKQFSELTQLLRRIDEEDKKEAEENKETSTSFLASFNPSNRVDLIARTVSLLERLHEGNKRRKTEVKQLQQDLDEAKKAGEETAARLKEAMIAPPSVNNNKFMMMVPMMMSSDGMSAMPGGHAPMMMSPYMHNPFFPQMTAAAVPASPTQQVAAMPSNSSTTPSEGTSQAATTTAPSTTTTTNAFPQAQQQHVHGVPIMTPFPPGTRFSFPQMMPTMTAASTNVSIPASGSVPGNAASTPSSGVNVPTGTQPSDNPSSPKDSKVDPSGMDTGANLAHCA